MSNKEIEKSSSDSITEYKTNHYVNGKPDFIGQCKDGVAIGNWKRYNKEGILINLSYYII